ncbi:MAG: translation initiation factor IF-2 [Prevotellaceae bacterium]|jgi:translation initiation factor IF-2|nr:translation initiation factor IF-2 [Prevotellaceae bacterium]
MSIRLSKIAKELNVGISTAVEFLHKKGHNIPSDPNHKVSDKEEELLYQEFSKDKSLKIASEKISQQRQIKVKEKKESVSIEGFGESQVEDIKTVVPEEQKPKFKIVGKMDLDAPKKQEKPKEQPVAGNTCKPPVKETVAVEKEVVNDEDNDNDSDFDNDDIDFDDDTDDNVSDENASEENKSGKSIFSLGKPELKSSINVIGKIDLSTINQQTRPKKKTKEEKRKEREQRSRTPFNKSQQTHGTAAGSENNDKKQHEIKTNVPKLNGPKVVGSIDLKTDADKKKKRKRIQKERVDIENYKNRPQDVANKGGGNQNQQKPGNNNKKKDFKKSVVKPEVNEEAVQKQIKETLARLTNKGQKNKASKHRRDKRELQSMKQMELEKQERLDQNKLKITEFVTVSELATMMDVPVTKVIGTCMNLGLMVSINQRLDAETINIVADEFGFETEYISAEVAEAIQEEVDNEEDLVSRPPIVTVMGHVDHGKTSLLDYIRKTNVIAGEAGGITQHIGAYNVTLPDGQQITFLDTPGHEAFTAMRARGAKVTDIAIIIVAADDDVMPQTVEAINHASVAGVPIIFAINKIDKPAANPEKIKESLANMNYLVEDWGGKYQSQDIAAKQGIGVPELMEKVLLEAEMLDLKANPNKKATGTIIESQLDKGRGYVSTVLVSNGTLKVGDPIVAGTHFGKIKAMFNERNQRITEATPSEPALILGLNGAPQAGDNFNVMASEQEVREIANKREQLQREQGLRTSRHLTLDEIGRRIALGNFQELNIIVKGDVDGSVEALADSLLKLSTEQIQVNVIHKAVGQISESDVMLAVASNAIIVGFQVRPSQAARKMAEKEEIDIRLYSIIYDAIEEIKAAMEGMLSPEFKEEITGSAEVQEVFKITKVGTVAGCLVREGKIKRGNKVRLIRDGIVVYTGDLASLKRFKEDVKEVATGYECGLNIQNYNDIKVGDMIEGFEQVEVQRTL